MVVTTTIRRKLSRSASVPVDQGDMVEDSPLEAHRTRLIANAVLNDTDALTTASRRHDQELMRDINARLAHSALLRPSPPPLRKSYQKPPVPNSKGSSSGSTHKSAVASLLSSKVSSEADSDVNHAVDLMMPITTRTLRAGSVPPVPSRAVYSAGIPAHSVVRTKVIHDGTPERSAYVVNGPGVYRTYTTDPSEYFIMQKAPVPESHYYYPQSAARLTPTADLAVREAHRNLDRIHNELKTDATLAPPPSPRTTVRTYATLDYEPRRRSSSYHGLRSDLRTRSPSPVYSSIISSDVPSYVTYGTSSSIPFYRTTSYDLNYPANTKVTTTTRRHVASASAGEPVVLSYPTTTFLARPGSDYSATHVPITSVKSADIDAMIRSARALPDMPSSGYKVSSGSSYHLPTSTPTASLSPPANKPKMSETRRRVRDVLCRVKNDPHYFD